MIKGHKTAVGEYKRWMKSRRNGEYAEIMLDIDTEEVWCDCFINSTDYKQYHSVKALYLSNILTRLNMEINMESVKYLALKVKDLYSLFPELSVWELEEMVIEYV